MSSGEHAIGSENYPGRGWRGVVKVSLGCRDNRVVVRIARQARISPEPLAFHEESLLTVQGYQPREPK